MPRNGISATALLIARSQVLLGREERLQALFDRETLNCYREFLASAGCGVRPGAGFDWQVLWARILERLSIPGIYLHYCLRKKEIRNRLTALLETGSISQVVVLAAGLDPLAAVLAPQFPSVIFYEVDLKETQSIKQQALKKIGHPENLFLLPGTSGLAAVSDTLCSSNYQRNLPVAFIAEGISMYLEAAEIDTLLKSLAEISLAKSLLFFTFMERSPEGRIGFTNSSLLVKLWLWLKGEPFRWGIEKESLGDVLLTHGWMLQDICDHFQLREKYLKSLNLHAEELAQGECLACAHQAARK